MCVENWVALALGAHQMRKANLNLKSRKMWAACCWHFICLRDTVNLDIVNDWNLWLCASYAKSTMNSPAGFGHCCCPKNHIYVYRLSFSDPKIIARNKRFWPLNNGRPFDAFFVCSLHPWIITYIYIPFVGLFFYFLCQVNSWSSKSRLVSTNV